MKKTKKAIKKQFNKKRQNPQRLKQRDNIWLETKNIQSKQLLKKLDLKHYGYFKITKKIEQEAFQLELPERWIIHNIFNKNLLTWCKEL